MLSTREISALMRSVAAVVKDHVGEAVRGLSLRIDELDALIKSIPAAEKGEDGEDGKDGRDGVDGKDGASVTADDVLPALREDVHRFLASIPAPRDGKDGRDGQSVTIEDVKGLLAEMQASWALDFERRAQDTLQRAIDRMPVPKNGVDGRDGRDGKDGRDALDLDDLEHEQDGDGRVTLRLVRGDVRKEIGLRFPVFVDRGVYQADEQYERGNGVTWGGSFWIAQKDAPQGKPGDGPDWRLAVKKGRDGRDGERGEKGEPGLNAK